MTTSLCPTQIRYTSGHQGTLLNPQEEIIRQLSSFLWGSILLSVIIIACIWQQINIIRRQKRIAQQGEDFSYAMIHDMKTPLSSILMGVQILQSNRINNQPEKRKKYIAILKDEGEHLLALSNKVLNLSKLEKHEVELNKEEVSYATAMYSVQHSVMSQIRPDKKGENNIKEFILMLSAQGMAHHMDTVQECTNRRYNPIFSIRCLETNSTT